MPLEYQLLYIGISKNIDLYIYIRIQIYVYTYIYIQMYVNIIIYINMYIIYIIVQYSLNIHQNTYIYIYFKKVMML